MRKNLEGYCKVGEIEVIELVTKNMRHNWDYNINNVNDKYKNFKTYYKAIVKKFFNLKFKDSSIKTVMDYSTFKTPRLIIYSNDKYYYSNSIIKLEIKRVFEEFKEKMEYLRDTKEIDYVFIDYVK